MVEIHFDRPVLDTRKTAQENIAIMDRWAADLVNNLNLLISKMNTENDDGK